VIEWAGKPVLIKTYIRGNVPTHTDAGMLVQVGRQLAHLHRIPAPDGIPEQFAYGPDAFGAFIEAHPNSRYSPWIAAKAAYLQQTISDALPRRMIHGDLFYDNTLFDGDRLMAILDFEEVCVYYRAFDIGMCAVGFCAQEGVASLDIVNALVAGYQSVTPLTVEERQQLQAMAVLGAAATSFWRYRQYHHIYPDAALARSHEAMDRLADGFEAFSAQEFEQAVF